MDDEQQPLMVVISQPTGFLTTISTNQNIFHQFNTLKLNTHLKNLIKIKLFTILLL